MAVPATSGVPIQFPFYGAINSMSGWTAGVGLELIDCAEMLFLATHVRWYEALPEPEQKPKSSHGDFRVKGQKILVHE
jgi:hypothetical protein